MLNAYKCDDVLCADKPFILDNAERQKCEIYTRVMGYHRPVSEFNLGKKSEYNQRTCFYEPVPCDLTDD